MKKDPFWEYARNNPEDRGPHLADIVERAEKRPAVTVGPFYGRVECAEYGDRAFVVVIVPFSRHDPEFIDTMRSWVEKHLAAE